MNDTVTMKSLADVCDILDSQRIPVTARDRVKGCYPYYGANGIQDYVDKYIFDDELVLLAEDGGNFGSKESPIAYRVSGKCWVNNHAHVLKPHDNTDVDYLCYALMFYNTEGLVNGATRQKLTQSAMKKMMIPFCDLKRQQEIVNELNAVSHLISLRQRQAEKLDELVKARFVEMFGDPCEMLHWECKKIEEVADVTVGVVVKPANFYTDDRLHGVKAFRSLNIGEMKVKDNDWVYFSEEGNAQNAKSQLHEGDVLVVRSGAPGTSCVVTKAYEGCNAIDVIIVHVDGIKLNPYYLCAFNNFPHGMRQMLKGVGGAAQKHLNVGKYNQMIVAIPPMKLQNEFVLFMESVDCEKDRIQRSAALLETLKRSLMQQYFG